MNEADDKNLTLHYFCYSESTDQKEKPPIKVIFCFLNDHSLGQQVPERRRTSLGLVQQIMMYSHHTASNTDGSTVKLTSRVQGSKKQLLIWDKWYKGEFRKEKLDS